MILDTSFLIDLMDGKQNAIAKAQELTKRNEAQIITTVSIFELSSGLAQSKKPDRERQKIMQILAEQTVWPLDDDGAHIGGRIDGELAKKGQSISPEDCMIAGIALSKKQTVLSRDSDFKRISTLETEPY
ncbi:type II toxin-antitoxin system VapC family toxin [Candidatus Woesearchaeota archaeon]|nr:MAG: type II toxin-antitoxin system VapC family toxin [Candidatus Woesearchaeota archaeon]